MLFAINNPTNIKAIANAIRSIKPNKCQASVSDTNHRELPQNFSPCLGSLFFHLLIHDFDLTQYVSGLNLILSSDDKSHIALAIPDIITNKTANII